MSKIIMHIDLNAFFATAEEIKNPAYRDKPIIVCGLGPRGVVSTASYEARKYGVNSAMPTYQAKKLCPNGIFLKGDYGYYSMLSRSFFSYLKKYSLLVEETSIDEGFVDMTLPLKRCPNPEEYLTDLMMGLYKEIGLKCSIGVAPTKFLAKMASDMKKPMGITIIRRKDLKKKLYPLPIESFYGIGRRSVPHLKRIGIKTIADFKRLSDEDDPRLKAMFGKTYASLKEEVNGFGSDKVEVTPFDPKSFGHSETLPYDTNDESKIKKKIHELALEVSEGIRRQGMVGKTIQLSIKDDDFKNYNKSITLPEPTNSYEVIAQNAIKLYETSFLGKLIRLVGVTVQNLFDPKTETVQMSFWNYENYEKMDKTKLLVNELNRKMEKPILTLAKEIKKNGNK